MILPFQIYRHFKGNLYVILSVALAESTLEPTVVYMSLNGDSKVWARSVTEFESLVPEGRENPTGQKHRFELVKDARNPISQCSTENLIKELKGRPDNPFNDIDLEGFNDKVLDKDYVVGDLSYPYPDYPDKPHFNIKAVRETLEEAQKFIQNNPHRCSSRTKICKSVLVEVESFD